MLPYTQLIKDHFEPSRISVNIDPTLKEKYDIPEHKHINRTFYFVLGINSGKTTLSEHYPNYFIDAESFYGDISDLIEEAHISNDYTKVNAHIVKSLKEIPAESLSNRALLLHGHDHVENQVDGFYGVGDVTVPANASYIESKHGMIGDLVDIRLDIFKKMGIRYNEHIQHGIKPFIFLRYEADRKYKGSQQKHFMNHNGQMKLLLSELRFFEWALKNESFVWHDCLYLGSSPGVHIPFLLDSFPKLSIIGYDPRNVEFKHERYTHVQSRFLLGERMDLVGKCIIISDIRSGIDDYSIWLDMELQKEIILTMRPSFHLSKFRVPWKNCSRTTYLSGNLVPQPFVGSNSIELRLMSNVLDVITYDCNNVRAFASYFNFYRTHNMSKRLSKSKAFHQLVMEGYCSCYDCTYMLRYCKLYSIQLDHALTKFQIFESNLTLDTKNKRNLSYTTVRPHMDLTHLTVAEQERRLIYLLGMFKRRVLKVIERTGKLLYEDFMYGSQLPFGDVTLNISDFYSRLLFEGKNLKYLHRFHTSSRFRGLASLMKFSAPRAMLDVGGQVVSNHFFSATNMIKGVTMCYRAEHVRHTFLLLRIWGLALTFGWENLKFDRELDNIYNSTIPKFVYIKVRTNTSWKDYQMKSYRNSLSDIYSEFKLEYQKVFVAGHLISILIDDGDIDAYLMDIEGFLSGEGENNLRYVSEVPSGWHTFLDYVCAIPAYILYCTILGTPTKLVVSKCSRLFRGLQRLRYTFPSFGFRSTDLDG
jgi:hypothetical protein